MADIRLGCVHMMLQTAPRSDSISDSKMNWGTCVVLPQPVSPEIIITCRIQNPAIIGKFIFGKLFIYFVVYTDYMSQNHEQ